MNAKRGALNADHSNIKKAIQRAQKLSFTRSRRRILNARARATDIFISYNINYIYNEINVSIAAVILQNGK